VVSQDHCDLEIQDDDSSIDVEKRSVCTERDDEPRQAIIEKNDNLKKPHKVGSMELPKIAKFREINILPE
jgi:hypothetical protein